MKVSEVKSVDDCERYCEGVVNDLAQNIITDREAMVALRDYTFHLHNMFSKKCREILKKNGVKPEQIKL